jgi:hypothetical protein
MTRCAQSAATTVTEAHMRSGQIVERRTKLPLSHAFRVFVEDIGLGHEAMSDAHKHVN